MIKITHKKSNIIRRKKYKNLYLLPNSNLNEKPLCIYVKSMDKIA